MMELPSGILIPRNGLCLARNLCVLAACILAALPSAATAAAWSRAHTATTPPSQAASGTLEFNRDIRPILSANCFSCHGSDPGARQAGLRLDQQAGATSKLPSGHIAIVPGNPGASEIIQRITATDDTRMPPSYAGSKLNPQQVGILRRWIAGGAHYQEHWAYVAPVRPPLPAVKNNWWPRNPIDRFILARLEKEGLKPSPTASRPELIRRLSLDLIGIPPTPEEVHAFVTDQSPDAYEKVVDRLLASPHFGERMAVPWLDMVRYADTDGYHSDRGRSVFPYRDYVINAFNSNMPFDRFTIEQIAGDLLPNATTEQKVASGYNRLNMITREGGAQAGEYLAKYAADRARTTSQVWMGATLGCAECHDHKFDPYTSKDFYSFEAFTADLQQQGVYPNGPDDLDPWIYVPSAEQTADLARLNAQIAPLQAAANQPGAAADVKAQLASLQKSKDTLLKTVPTMIVAVSVKPAVTRILPRGNWMDQSGEIVQPAVPHFLPQLPAGEPANRLALAKWLVSRTNPLTARVIVNRFWALLFGAGIVRTPGDFGTQGAVPTHQKLLDWLAVEFMDSGWDVKHMMKLIVMSNTYRQTSFASKQLVATDPFNLLVARQNRFRLDAEFVRDNALAISGLLSPRIGGRSVFPYQPDGYWANCNTFDGPLIYHQDHGEDLYRRGLYTYWKRSFLNPSLLAFDAPTREECSVDRSRSNTPLQSLVLLNDPTYVEAARVFAEHILREGGSTYQSRLDWAFQKAVCRNARPTEMALLANLERKQQTGYAADPASAQKLISVGEAPVAKDLNPAELAAWTSVARVILNMVETVTRE